MKLLILFNLLFAGCLTMNNSQLNNEILLFENYVQADIMLQEYFLNENIFKDSTFLSKERLTHTEQGCKIDGALFDILCNLEIINQWNIYSQSDISPYSSDYDKFVEERKQELKLKYLGKLELSRIFDSFLILVSDGEKDDYNIIKNVFLVNVSNNVIASITRVCNYTCFDGECDYIFTKELEKNIFEQRDIEVSSNMILPEEMKPDNEETYIRFTYDKKGRLTLL